MPGEQYEKGGAGADGKYKRARDGDIAGCVDLFRNAG